MTHILFPKIRQFRDAAQNVAYKARFANGMHPDGQPVQPEPPPTLDFVGTVKLHGTNAAIQLHPGKDPVYQSRNRIITPLDDNMGFASAMTLLRDIYPPEEDPYDLLYEDILDAYDMHAYDGERIVVYGEWCGEGIQQGVALSKLPKQFIIFAIKHNDKWLDIEKLGAVRTFETVNNYAKFTETVDFTDPGPSQNRMVTITEQVEELCPAGYEMGVEGVGEGVVWRCVTPGWESSKFWFKVKGQKHREHNVRVLKEVDLDKANTVQAFVEGVVTEARLNKGIDYLKEMGHEVDRKSTGIFLKWVANDIFEEEYDTMVELLLTKKDVGKAISAKAKPWWFDRA